MCLWAQLWHIVAFTGQSICISFLWLQPNEWEIKSRNYGLIYCTEWIMVIVYRQEACGPKQLRCWLKLWWNFEVYFLDSKFFIRFEISKMGWWHTDIWIHSSYYPLDPYTSACSRKGHGYQRQIHVHFCSLAVALQWYGYLKISSWKSMVKAMPVVKGVDLESWRSRSHPMVPFEANNQHCFIRQWLGLNSAGSWYLKGCCWLLHICIVGWQWVNKGWQYCLRNSRWRQNE